MAVLRRRMVVLGLELFLEHEGLEGTPSCYDPGRRHHIRNAVDACADNLLTPISRHSDV